MAKRNFFPNKIEKDKELNLKGKLKFFDAIQKIRRN